MYHGSEQKVVTRRDLMKGAALAPLASVLANPVLAKAVAGGLREVSIKTQGDGRVVNASMAVPDVTPAPAVILIHEWWGLNDQIKSVAAEVAKQGYLALAVDLYGGNAATTPEGARTLMSGVDPEVARDTVRSWAAWLKAHRKSTGKVASMGWCFGGGWSLETAIEAGTDAAIIYYGRVDQPLDRLSRIKGPVLGHFATHDGYINKPMVDGFVSGMAAAGKAWEVHWYEADHAFANPTSARYDQGDAALSWQRSLEFLKKNLL